MNIQDPRAVVVSDLSVRHHDAMEIVDSNISFVNALFAQLVRPGELAPEALHSYYVDWFTTQMLNGSFAQFVYNSRWQGRGVQFVHDGLAAMGAKRELAAFERASKAVDSIPRGELDAWLAQDLFGDNPGRDTIEEMFDGDVRELRAKNAEWLRALPNLVVAPIEAMEREVERRGAALPDREARIAEARAKAPRDIKLECALCERAGHVFERATAARQRTYEGEKIWTYIFLTDRGVFYMIDLGTRALMFENDRGHDVDPSKLVAEIACEPE